MLRISSPCGESSPGAGEVQKIGKSRPGEPGGFFEMHFSRRNLHDLVTVHTGYIDFLGGTDGLTATGTNIFASAAELLSLGGIVRVVPGAADGQLVAPMLGGTEGFQSGGRLSDRVANFGVVVNQKTSLFGFFLETLVMVGIAPAGILDAVQLAVVMDHFMNQGGDGVRYGTVQAFGTQVDFIKRPLTLDIRPYLFPDEVTIDLGAGLDGDNRFWKCIIKILFVQNVKGFFEKFCCLTDGHDVDLLFVSVNSNGELPTTVPAGTVSTGCRPVLVRWEGEGRSPYPMTLRIIVRTLSKAFNLVLALWRSAYCQLRVTSSPPSG